MTTYKQRDYDMVSSVIKAEVDHVGELHAAHVASQSQAIARLSSTRRIMLSFIDQFEADNPRFNKARFRKACGFEVPNNLLPKGRTHREQ